MADLAKVSKSLIDKLGKVEITLTQNSLGAYDPATSLNAAGTQATDTFYALPDKVSKDLINGSDIKTTDLMLYFSPNSTTLTPAQNDMVSFNGQDYKVVNVNDVWFSGGQVLHTLVVRKS